METNKFSQYAFMAILAILLSVSTSHAQFLNDPTNSGVGNTDINTNMYRKGNVSIGGTNPIPSQNKFYVKGRISQLNSGTFGTFGTNDQWASLGESFGPPGIAQTYGLFSQWGGTSLTTGIKNGAHGLVSWSGNGRLDFDHINSSNVPSTKMSILSNGRMGLGTTNPINRLHLDLGSSRDGIRITSDGNSSAYSDIQLTVKTASNISNNQSFGWIISHRKDGYFSNSGSGGSSLEFFGVNNNTPGSARYYAPLCFKPDGDVILASSKNAFSGNVGIGTTSPQYKLDVNGTTACTGGFWSSSDRRFKKEIKTVESALDKIKKLEGVSYKFKKQKFGEISFEESNDRVELGFIAQDLEKVFPELVRENKNGYYAVRYDGLIPVLVEALKDQDVVVENQKEEINILNEKVDRLEDQLAIVIEAINALQNNTEQKIDLEPTTIETESKATLSPNHPNPVSGITTIDYTVEQENAQLIIYDLTGKILDTYELTKGQGSIEYNAADLINGTYIYAIIANGQTLAQQKMIILK